MLRIKVYDIESDRDEGFSDRRDSLPAVAPLFRLALEVVGPDELVRKFGSELVALLERLNNPPVPVVPSMPEVVVPQLDYGPFDWRRGGPPPMGARVILRVRVDDGRLGEIVVTRVRDLDQSPPGHWAVKLEGRDAEIFGLAPRHPWRPVPEGG